MKLKWKLDQSGMTLIQVMVAVGITSIIALTIATLMQMSYKIQDKLNKEMSLQDIKYILMASLKNKNTWANTIGLNSDMDCLLPTSSGCTVDQQGKIELVQIGSDTLIDNRKEKSGLNWEGDVCSGFSAKSGNGSNQCPLRYDLTWRVVGCSSAPCVAPSVKIDGVLGYNPHDFTSPLNTNRYNFSVVQDGDPDILESACNMLGGVFNRETHKCEGFASKDLSNLNCESGQTVVFGESGDIVCGASGSGTGDDKKGKCPCGNHAYTGSKYRCGATLNCGSSRSRSYLCTESGWVCIGGDCGAGRRFDRPPRCG